jgi:NAD(P)H-flavin reductase
MTVSIHNGNRAAITLAVGTLGVPVAGSLLFLLWPESFHLLYVQSTSVANWTGVTQNQWWWMLLTGITMVLTCHLAGSSALRRMGTTLSGSYHKYLLSTTQAFRVFLLVNGLWMTAALLRPLVSLLQQDDPQKSFGLQLVRLVGGKAAWPALWNLAFVVFPVQRTSQILAALGLSAHEALPLHYWMGHAILVWLSIHTVLLSVVYYHDAINNHESWWSKMIPARNGLFSEGIVNFTGWIGYLCFVVLWVSSRPIVRHRWYNTYFYVLHLGCTAGGLVFSQLHDYNTLFLVQPALAGWMVDRLLRALSPRRTVIRGLAVVADADNGQPQGSTPVEQARSTRMTITTTTPAANNDAPIVSLTLPIPLHWPEMEPGMFVYLTVPALGRQSHPFSIGSWDRSAGVFTIHIKALGDWTTQLFNHAQQTLIEEHHQQEEEEEEDTLSNLDESSPPQTYGAGAELFVCEVEGPYGGYALHVTLECYDHCLFIAGGTGITGITTFVQLRQQSGRTSRVVWLTRSQESVDLLLRGQHQMISMDDLHHDGTTNLQIYVSNSTHLRASSDDTTTMTQPTASRCTTSITRHFSSVHEEPFTVLASCRHLDWITLLISWMGNALSLVLARQLCTNQPLYYREGTLRRVHQCYSLWSSSHKEELCVTCESMDEADTEFPCCTVPICYYCFRGAPLFLTLVVAPIWTLVISMVMTRLLQKPAFPQRRRRRSNELEYQNLPDSNNDDYELEEENEPALCPSNNDPALILPPTSTPFQMTSSLDELLGTNVTIEYRRLDLPSFLLRQYHYDDRDTAVVVCGPESLRHSVTKHCQDLPNFHVYRME